MSTRSANFNRPQFGLEADFGDPIAADKQFTGIMMRMRPITPKDPFRPGGNRFNTDAPPQKRSSAIRYEGRLNLGGDIVYLLSSLIKTVASPGTWEWEWNAFEAETFKSLTCETGSANGAEQCAGTVVDSLELRWSRTEASISGTMFGKDYTPDIAITAAPTKLPKALALPGKVKVEVGDASDSLTKLERCLEANFAIRSAHGQLYTLDEDEESFTDVVPRAPDLTSRLVLENNSVAAGLMDDLKTSALKFCQITSYGPLIGAGPDRHLMRILFPFKFPEADTGDQDEVDTGIFDILPIYDEEMDTAIQIEVVNELGAY